MTSSNKNSGFWIHPSIERLDPYVPGSQVEETGWIKLNTNENPYPASPQVYEAMEAEHARLHLYPNPQATKLREKLADFYCLRSDQVIAGNGSDDILNLLIRTFSDAEHPAGAMHPSYSLYPVLAEANGTKWISVEYDKPFQLPVDSIVNSGCNLFFLTCPHAPSGVSYALNTLESLAKEFSGLLVVDEAYADFAESSALSILSKCDNVFVTRTFSKAWGLAGLRVGFGVGTAQVVKWLDSVRDSYNLDRMAQAAAMAALSDHDYYGALIQKISYTRDFYRREFEKLGWFVYPSQANFIYVEPRDPSGKVGPEIADSLFQYLLEHKILIRYFPKHALTRNFLRISIGDENQMMSLWDCIQRWIKKE